MVVEVDRQATICPWSRSRGGLPTVPERSVTHHQEHDLGLQHDGRTCSPGAASSAATSPPASARRRARRPACRWRSGWRPPTSRGAAMPGAAVYAWHCDRAGRYSLDDVEDQNHLRGVQAADASGDVTSTSIFPPAHSGRRPHVHFEVHTSLAEATAPTNVITSAQLALPKAIHDGVYATDGYVASVANMARTSLTWDMVGHGLRRRRREDPAGHDAPGL